MSVDTRSAQEAPPSACLAPASASFERLAEALRRPQVLFKEMADPCLVARCEMADWEATTASLRRILDRYDVAPDLVMAKLHLAAEFMKHHDIPLEGSPWLCTYHDESDIWARYDIHTALSGPDISVWQDRFDDVLASRDLRIECFQIWLLDRGPR
ncbi:hypothetical protein [Mitsuaria sp. GD03876]|uniref:hypothetical protein n=1 Tax=Mitsuaria sp. GD03876 TaxID=2975399 RepID=UPI00244A7479|nr:hypothetical protein [Mitsuaria sp. GD03876]MDH0863962.1 hypothetical protein [Mitsuaria sp. GD03876]